MRSKGDFLFLSLSFSGGIFEITVQILSSSNYDFDLHSKYPNNFDWTWFVHYSNFSTTLISLLLFLPSSVSLDIWISLLIIVMLCQTWTHLDISNLHRLALPSNLHSVNFFYFAKLKHWFKVKPPKFTSFSFSICILNIVVSTLFVSWLSLPLIFL